MTLVPVEYDDKTVLITGGLGFIGSNLAHHLASSSHARIRIVDSLHARCGGNVRNLDGIARQVDVHVLDLRDSSRLPGVVEGVDVIFNLAGQVSHIDSMQDPLQDLEANGQAHLSLLEACRRVSPQVRIVYSSTRQCYGRPLSLPVKEDHPVLPVDINGVNKYAAELYHQVYRQAYGLETCALRLTNTYGPRQLIRHARQGFVGWFLHQILCGDEIALYGDGCQVRDLNYVDCVVDALLLAGVHPSAAGRVYNLGSDHAITLLELVQLMISISGKGRYRLTPFPEERRRIDIGSYYGDFSAIRQELGWNPGVSLKDGLARTLDFFEHHREIYLPAQA